MLTGRLQVSGKDQETAIGDGKVLFWQDSERKMLLKPSFFTELCPFILLKPLFFSENTIAIL